TTEDFEIDTGDNGAVSLTSQRIDRLLADGRRPAISTPHITALGTVNFRLLRSPPFELAGLKYADMVLAETRDDMGHVGTEFFQRHLATLDYPANRLYLNPGKEFARPSEENMCGIRPARIGADVIAKFVDAASPAFAAGVRPGDVLVKVN